MSHEAHLRKTGGRQSRRNEADTQTRPVDATALRARVSRKGGAFFGCDMNTFFRPKTVKIANFTTASCYECSWEDDEEDDLFKRRLRARKTPNLEPRTPNASAGAARRYFGGKKHS